jgi:pimeloyl-ACP methyl ester carboxylesterase
MPPNERDDMDTAVIEKSTNVRKALPPAVRRAVGWVSAVAPALVQSQAEKIFFTPRGKRGFMPPRGPGKAVPFTVPSGEYRVTGYTYGAGPLVFLVHGWAGHARQLARFVTPLVESGKRVVAIDLPAHGASTGKETTLFDMAKAIRDVAAVCGEVEGAVGHSLGAAALTWALRSGLKVEKVVLLAPALEPSEFAHKVSAGLGMVRAAEAGFVARIEARVGRSMDSMRLSQHVGDLSTAALVLHDPADEEIPLAHGKELAGAWPGAQFETVGGVGHNGILKSPWVVERATRFLANPS